MLHQLLLCACGAFHLAFSAISCSDKSDNDLDCVNCYQDLAETLLKSRGGKGREGRGKEEGWGERERHTKYVY